MTASAAFPINIVHKSGLDAMRSLLVGVAGPVICIDKDRGHSPFVAKPLCVQGPPLFYGHAELSRLHSERLYGPFGDQW